VRPIGHRVAFIVLRHPRHWRDHTIGERTMAYFERTRRAGIGRGSVTGPDSVKLACTFRKRQFAAVRRIAEGKGETAASAIRRLVDEALRARARDERETRGTRRQVI
jgi:hypothetical protein